VETAPFVLHETFGFIYRCDIQAGHVGAGFGETHGDALPEAAGRSRYEGDFAIKAEVLEDAH
jgi:hypothetical protein